MIWDGFYFFGFNDTNLRNRLNGAKLKYMDKFKNKKFIFSTLTLLIIVGYVLASEISHLNSPKLQSINQKISKKYIFPMNEALPIVGTAYYFTNELFKKA